MVRHPGYSSLALPLSLTRGRGRTELRALPSLSGGGGGSVLGEGQSYLGLHTELSLEPRDHSTKVRPSPTLEEEAPNDWEQVGSEHKPGPKADSVRVPASPL